MTSSLEEILEPTLRRGLRSLVILVSQNLG